jgi:hypothetical protein
MSQNVFKLSDGALMCRRIKREEIMPTIKWLEKITGLDFTKDVDESGYPVKWLGTTGRKADSGDLDLSVSESDITKDQLKNVLSQWALKSGISSNDIMNTKVDRANWIQLSGDNIHFRAPIMGDEKNGFVQTDFMFSPDTVWQQWSMRGGLANSPYRGMHRHVLIASIARAQNYKYSYKNGLIDPTTDQTITKNPNEIAKALLGNDATAIDLETTENIIKKIKNRSDYPILTAAARETLSKEGVILPESLEIGSIRWLRYLIDACDR